MTTKPSRSGKENKEVQKTKSKRKAKVTQVKAQSRKEKREQKQDQAELISGGNKSTARGSDAASKKEPVLKPAKKIVKK